MFKIKKSWTPSFIGIIKFLRFGGKIITPNSSIFKFVTDIEHNKLILGHPKNTQSKRICSKSNDYEMEWIWNNKKIKKIYNHHRYILYLHGGAFCMGNTSNVKNLLSEIAIKTNSVILSVDYRRSPEHKYPTPNNDCLNAYLYLVNKITKHNPNPNPTIIVMGDSAGGNLAISLISELIKSNYKISPTGCILISPWVDLTDYGNLEDLENLENSSWETNKGVDFVRADLAKFFALEYINQSTHGLKEVSPLYFSNEILSKFPPTLIEYGECEVLHDQIYKFSVKLKNLNVDITHNPRYEMIHNYPMFYFTKIPQADDFFNSIKEFIKNKL